jgi:hypothetical protein
MIQLLLLDGTAVFGLALARLRAPAAKRRGPVGQKQAVFDAIDHQRVRVLDQPATALSRRVLDLDQSAPLPFSQDAIDRIRPLET